MFEVNDRMEKGREGKGRREGFQLGFEVLMYWVICNRMKGRRTNMLRVGQVGGGRLLGQMFFMSLP